MCFLLRSEFLKLLYKYYGMHFAILDLFLLCNFFFENPHLFFKSTHIFQNIPESQNAFHAICRIKILNAIKKPHCFLLRSEFLKI